MRGKVIGKIWGMNIREPMTQAEKSARRLKMLNENARKRRAQRAKEHRCWYCAKKVRPIKKYPRWCKKCREKRRDYSRETLSGGEHEVIE